MKIAHCTLALLAAYAAMAACLGCRSMPGYPKAGDEAARPDQVLGFQALYKQNCSGCHGENGRDGAAIALNNPAYLAIAGAETLRTVTAQGMHGTLMPAFARSAGGMLTDEQVNALVQGMLERWGRPREFAGVKLPAYASIEPGNAAEGAKAYATACARCHGTDGTGVPTTAQSGATQHSIVDASYLALVSDQSLRSVVVAAHPEKSTPDWRAYVPGRVLTEQEITNIVAWLGMHRAAMDETQPGATPKTGKEGQ
ncbi:MAG: c-type cytochrome [Terracidiphilus sp.]